MLLTADAYVYELQTVNGPTSNAYANFQFGGNGSFWGPPEYSISNGTDESDGLKEWDSNDSGGVDSDYVDFSFSANASGMSLSLSGSITGTITSGGVSSFSNVSITAGVQTYAEFDFASVSILFYDSSGNATSQYGSLDGPYVDMKDPSSGGVGEQILSVTTPSATPASGVTVTGQVKLLAPTSTWPAANDLFGSIGIS